MTKQTQASKELAGWVDQVVREFCRTPANNLQNGTGEPAWGNPLVGFARGDDPIFAAYKEHVGPFHWTPMEIFSLTYPNLQVTAQELTVVAYILPQTEATKADNRQETLYPAERWVRSRLYGEQFNEKLRGHVADTLTQAGYPAVSPMIAPQWERRDSAQFVWSSTWSERHAAHACGLGTFGLCDGLITPLGKAIRVGSVVVQAQIPPTPRPYADHQAYCLFYVQGTCGDCIDRCPAGAISAAGHDKVRCSTYQRGVREGYIRETYGIPGYGCGLCQTAVPCESRIPAPLDQ